MRHRIPLPERGGVFLGRDYFKHDLVSLRKPARITHMHVVGASNRGKSNLLEVALRQDILQLEGEPRGVTLIDPHGSTYQSLVEWTAANRINKHRTIRLIDPAATDFAFSFNPFRALSHFDLASLVDLLVNATIQIWGVSAITQSPQVAEVLAELYTAIGALGLTLADSNDFLLRECEKVRRHHLERLQDINQEAWMWWEDLERLSSTRRDEYLAPVRRRLRLFLGSPFVKRIFSQRSRSLDLAEEMDRGSILLINLKPGPTLSTDAARLLGALLVNEFYTSIFRRRKEGLQHYLYLDECQLFLTPDIARILDQARKFKLSLVLSHQHLGHLLEAGEAIYRSVMTNCNCKVVFGGLDPDDAEYMARIIFRGSFDLQKPKRAMIRPTVVGQEKVWLAQESASRNQSRSEARSWSTGNATTENKSTTKQRSQTSTVTNTHSFSDAESTNWSAATIDTSSEGESSSQATTTVVPGMASFLEPAVVTSSTGGDGSSSSRTTGTVSSTGGSNTHTEGFSTSRGTARGRSVALTKGSAKTTSSAQGGSITDATGCATTTGRGESFAPVFKDLPTATYALDEQIHIRSVALAHTPQGQAWVRVGSERARHIVVPYVGDQFVLRERVERVRRELLISSPFVGHVSDVDEEYRAYRQALLEAAAPPEPDAEPTIEMKPPAASKRISKLTALPAPKRHAKS